MASEPKLLLTSVFGPYAVDDEYGRKENLMELFHNQVTREQGLFSYRFNHASFGLYFLAENIETPTVVLDFPTLPQFVEELKKGYDYVGISYVRPNFKKAQKWRPSSAGIPPAAKSSSAVTALRSAKRKRPLNTTTSAAARASPFYGDCLAKTRRNRSDTRFCTARSTGGTWAFRCRKTQAF